METTQDCANATPVVQMSPWVVQGIIYELVTSFMLRNSPTELGYAMKEKFMVDKTASDIFVDIAYNYDATKANKRPSVFISRGDCDIGGRTMGHTIASAPQDSEVQRLLINTLPINIAVIAAPVGMVEMLADYVKQSFVSFQQEIQSDFRFRRFRLKSVSKPQNFVEAKEYFVVNLSVEVVYDEGWILRRDDLRLKSVGMEIFDSLQPQLRLD